MPNCQRASANASTAGPFVGTRGRGTSFAARPAGPSGHRGPPREDQRPENGRAKPGTTPDDMNLRAWDSGRDRRVAAMDTADTGAARTDTVMDTDTADTDTVILRIPWDEALTAYDFGHDHPLAPVRVELTMALARQYGVLDAPEVSLEPVPPADDALLELVHAPEYVQAVKSVAHTGYAERLRYGLGTDDNPVFPGMHEASALVVGASVAAADAVWSGRSAHAANMAGGLHHAM